MTPQELYQAGRLQEAIQALGAELRQNPTDSRRRTFLFELLCFAGELERAAKQLNIVAGESPDAEIGALLYRSALSAERLRQEFFETRQYDEVNRVSTARSRPGTLNGRAFQTIEDADPRIGPRLEVFVAGEYVWLPFEHIGSVKAEAPRRLRDLIWSTAIVMTGPSFKGREFGEVLLPAICPLSYRHASDQVKLGRTTEWQEIDAAGTVPVGQKLLVLDGEEAVPFLEVRELEFAAGETEDAPSASGAAQ